MKNILLTLVLLLSTGCYSSSNLAPARTPLNLPNPEPLKLKEVQFYVIPRSDQGTDPDIIKHGILFGLSELGYKSLAENVQDIINYIGHQGKVLDSYRKYYEQGNGTPSAPILNSRDVYRPGMAR